MNIKWSEPSIEDLEGIKDFIGRDSEFFANQFVSRIFESVEKLLVFPNMGRVVPEFEDEKIRELIFQNYRIIYYLEEEIIYILNIIHGARDVKKHGENEWEII